MGSIPTRSRHFRSLVAASLLVLAAATTSLGAQTPDSAASAAAALPARKPPLSPGGAFLRSFVVPGWSQLQLHRPVSALVFLGLEGTFLGLSIKANHDVKVARLTDQTPDSSVVVSKKRAREDWLVLLGFNHLMAGLEGYVASHLYDFPRDLHIRMMPGQGVTASASIPLRIR